MNLTLYGNRFTLYGRPLVLYGSAPTPPITPGGGGGSAAWLPTIHLDRHGRRIDPDELKRKTLRVIPKAAKEEVREVISRVEEVTQAALDFSELFALADELRGIAALIPALQAALVAQWQDLAYDIARMAEDERDVELLLMAM